MPYEELSKNNEITVQNKTISLFQFIRELNKLKQKVILNVNEYPWHLSISSLQTDSENVHIYYPDHIEDEVENEGDATQGNAGNILISVHKPEFQKCPEPDDTFREWLLPGWDNYRNDSQVRDYQQHRRGFRLLDADL